MQEYEKELLEELESLKAENKGLKEYADSRDESIAVYREEIKELKADLKLNAEMLAKQCDLAREAEAEVKYKHTAQEKEGFPKIQKGPLPKFRCKECKYIGRANNLVERGDGNETLRCPRCGSPDFIWV